MRRAPAVGPRTASGRCRWSGRRRCPGAPPARDLEARDTRGKPQHSRGVATYHVAEVVHPEVESTRPDGHDQKDPPQRRGHLRAPAMDPEDPEYVDEHAVANQRAHRVATRKTPAFVWQERRGIRQPLAADH